jgi:hypothetical protein
MGGDVESTELRMGDISILVLRWEAGPPSQLNPGVDFVRR